MNTKKVTTRQIDGVEFDDAGNIVGSYSVRPAIDDALSMLAFLQYGVTRYSGKLKTAWRNGGMCEPQIPGYCKEAKKSIIVQPMKKHLPDKHTGWAIWRLNSGESSGAPELIPFY